MNHSNSFKTGDKFNELQIIFLRDYRHRERIEQKENWVIEIVAFKPYKVSSIYYKINTLWVPKKDNVTSNTKNYNSEAAF